MTTTASPKASPPPSWLGDSVIARGDLNADLLQLPALAADKSKVVRMAIDDYRVRKKRGERLTRSAFAGQFPPYQRSLARELQIVDFELANPDLIDEATSVAAQALSQTPPWPEVGDRLLGFTLLERLGEGGFSRVFLASESALGDRPVVVKISLEGKDQPDAAAEAETLGRLRHENIVPIHSVQKDTLSGFTVVCMPFLGRATLWNILDLVDSFRPRPCTAQVILKAVDIQADEESQRIVPSQMLREGSYVDGVLEMGIHLAQGLAFVHERKIFHRDLKPSNVLVRRDGRPMLLDFNLSFDQRSRSKKQMLGGTLLYMSPEQLEATDSRRHSRTCLLDARADLFSLGVILYELLAGKHPFVDGHALPDDLKEREIRNLLEEKQTAGAPSLRQANCQVDGFLADVVEKCLAKDPGRRFASAAELADSLERCLSPARRLRRWLIRHPGAPWIGTALFLFVMAISTFLFVMRRPYAERQLEDGIHALQAGRYADAVAFLDRSLAGHESVLGRMARGRAYAKLGKFSDAVADFSEADKMETSGHKKACIAYCYSRLMPPLHDLAIGTYRKAIDAGYATPIIHNNLAFSLLKKADDYEAKKYLRWAIERDPRFQMAYANFVLAELTTAKAGLSKRFKVTREGLRALEKAFATGPISGPLHHDAARFFTLAGHLETRWEDLALEHAKKAVEHGVNPTTLLTDANLQSLRAKLAHLTSLRPLTGPAAPMDRVQDPFLSIED